MNGEIYIGLISGTSMDGIDAALVRLDETTFELIDTLSSPYPEELKALLIKAIENPADCTVDDSGSLDRWVGECFRDAAENLCKKAGVRPNEVRAIGSHGQTLRHCPGLEHPFTLQIGDPATIATGSGIDTVADFRRADLALGGQGAPLVPPFHAWAFGDKDHGRAVLNIGGIANLTLLPSGGADVTGFDTGPGNGLMDAWSRRVRDIPFDDSGYWAGSGNVIDSLLNQMLDDPYFDKNPPKSTGFEYFNIDWIDSHDIASLAQEDVQATLCELTAQSIAHSLSRGLTHVPEVLVCGGGAHNKHLMSRLDAVLDGATVESTATKGLHPDWVEAVAFAWLARRTIHGQLGNLPTVTGARRKTILGAVHRSGS